MKKIFITFFVFFLVTIIVLFSISFFSASTNIAESTKDMINEIGKIIIIITFVITMGYAFLLSLKGKKRN